ncbi:hypothetical protein CS022_13200 [Veronia nyctiphanis]|uniref:Uncharacterized protein n=1 Tax=Veronia nyctiphanis TaxID=1278244 RepID=A0A4Q0YRS0_9GAMM|nr:hypothetical protein [Veronia nyctiphanis]RXJ72814.1 hypothetical protein CS022_13200 [Veronia nyctiphanis]
MRGNANFEWLFLVDAFITLPIVCLLCAENKKKAAIQILALCMLAVFIGSMIIPDSSKVVWPYLESLRLLSIPILVLFEVIAVVTVLIAIKAAMSRKQDIDIAIHHAVSKLFGTGNLAKLSALEVRVWTFFLMATRVKPEQFEGESHFTYHKKDHAHSNAFGFLMIMVLKRPSCILSFTMLGHRLPRTSLRF